MMVYCHDDRGDRARRPGRLRSTRLPSVSLVAGSASRPILHVTGNFGCNFGAYEAALTGGDGHAGCHFRSVPRAGESPAGGPVRTWVRVARILDVEPKRNGRVGQGRSTAG